MQLLWYIPIICDETFKDFGSVLNYYKYYWKLGTMKNKQIIFNVIFLNKYFLCEIINILYSLVKYEAKSTDNFGCHNKTNYICKRLQMFRNWNVKRDEKFCNDKHNFLFSVSFKPR